MARNSGAKIIGGCCGTKSEHLLSMRSALESKKLGPIPSLDKVESEIGVLSNQMINKANKHTSERSRRRV